MIFPGQRIILTGAAGGIGYRLALLLAARGTRLALVERNVDRVEEICAEIKQLGGSAKPIVLDLAIEGAAQHAAETAVQLMGGVDMVINNAGIMDFTLFERQDPKRIQQMININVTAPLLLTHALLPYFLEQNSGRIVNIGSAFGSIGFPHFATYCASKFAMRGFSEALRRELTDSPIGVTYISPRATKTPLNNDVTTQMLEATKTNMDEPEYVAAQIILAIETGRKEHFIGQPESFFARLNGLLPRLVDKGLLNNTRIARSFAESINKSFNSRRSS